MSWRNMLTEVLLKEQFPVNCIVKVIKDIIYYNNKVVDDVTGKVGVVCSVMLGSDHKWYVVVAFIGDDFLHVKKYWMFPEEIKKVDI